MLVRALRMFPIPEVLDPNQSSLLSVKKYPQLPLITRLVWGVWRRVPGARRSLNPIIATAWLADRLVARWIPKADIFHGLNGNALRSLAVAKRLGAITLLESAMMHPRRWQSEVLSECRQFGVHPRDCSTALPAALIRRLEREYKIADRIIVPSHAARRSFEDEGVSNVDVVPPGVDEKLFHPLESGDSNKFRVCYTGRVELAKGVLYLLEAWKRLQLRDAELVMVGEVRPELKSALRQYSDPSLTFAGFLPREQAAEIVRTCSLFVFPSLHEGLALAILEAMASGLPVIATEDSGAKDCLVEGVSGFLVRARNVEDLTDRITWAYQNREELVSMGMQARAAVENRFTVQCYETRMIEYYRSLVRHTN